MSELARHQAAVEGMFTRLGNLVKDVTYRAKTGEDLDEETGKPSRTFADQAARMFFEDYTTREVTSSQQQGSPGSQESTIETGDRKGLISTINLGATVPRVGDRVVLADGEAWDVISTPENSDEALWILHLRLGAPDE